MRHQHRLGRLQVRVSRYGSIAGGGGLINQCGAVIEQQILAGSLDEKNKTGFRTRHLRFKPGVYTTVPFVHEYWEEVYLVSGDLIVGNDANGIGGQKFGPNTYACRPPGTPHGPFKSDTGCLLLEMHYFDEQ